MDLRVSYQTMVDNALVNTNLQTDALARLQEQAATGQRLQTPSDDPAATSLILTGQAEQARLDTYLTNINTVRATLNSSVSTLQDASNTLSNAKSIAIEAGNSGNGASSMESLAQEVDNLLSRLLNNANAQQNNHYLYGGTATRTAPFVVTATDSQGRPLSIAYQGDSNATQVVVGANQTVTTYSPGNQIFQSTARQATIYSGNTGAAAGTGTDSATGQGTLLISHTATVFTPGSGVQAGTDSATGDTIIGPAGAHRLTITDTSGTGSSGTISLDGGPAVSFTNQDTNLKLETPTGDVVFLNTTAITPGFNGTVDITANGSLSVDGGASSVAINFSGNQVVSNSKTGAVTNVNSTQVRRTGTDNLNYQGTFDAFQILMTLRDDLRNTAGLPQSQQLRVISQRITELDRVNQGVLQTVGEQSAQLQSLDALQSHTQSVQLTTKEFVSQLEGADMAQVAINLQSQQNLFKLTLAFTARLFDQSLLDFLH